ncbi:type I polyketide synthase [Pedobacter sp. HMWF019]|uniref:type I polyketide synthase n=1 Tax=Pedobacter sp. HMWF019 TaxID=2056856 RepID=UPI000D349914|nr:type I polyketide synthase [Pedobacter sp. HMWF019]PTS96737.1 type I polyketide synthase [Pedobacter sp. HMWF019]
MSAKELNTLHPPVHELFEVSTQIYPDATAVVFGEESLSYKELSHKADQLSYALIDAARDEEIIGVDTTKCLEMVISVLAILKAGKAYLPLDPGYPEHRLEQITKDSRIKTCLSLSKNREIYQNLGLRTIRSDEVQQGMETPVPFQSLNACILYTSGSTGKPKGVCLGHKGLVNFLFWQHKYALTGNGINALQFCHLSFDASFQEIFVTLTSGGTLFLLTEDIRLDAGQLLKFIIKHDINKAFLPYVTLQYLTEAAVAEHVFPSKLKEIITGGELLKITPTIRTFFNALPDSVLVNVYGPTETTIWVTELKLSGNALDWPPIPTIGSVMANSSIYFLDEALQLVKDGEIGEMFISGPGLANGYLHQPEMTADRFIDWLHPSKGSIRLYRTGDLGKLMDNKEIEFLGRKDGQVKIRGNRVEIGEIEIAIMQQADISQVAVVLREDQPGRKYLVAYVVGQNDNKDGLLLKSQLADLLPDYMVPSTVVWMDELPKTTSGKVDRLKLPEPESFRPDLNVIYQTPHSQMEKDIAGVWMELFRYDRIGVYDNFFDLGGNSLLAQKTVATLKYEFNYELPITKLYQYPSIKGIAGFLGPKQVEEEDLDSALLKTALSGDIAVIGMAGRFPGANTIEELWSILSEGKETTTFFKEKDLDNSIPDLVKNDPAYVKARGIIEGADQFDPAFFGLNVKLAELMDPQLRIFLEICWELLEKTGNFSSKHLTKTGVFGGSGANTYFVNNILQYPEKIESQGNLQVLTVNEKDYLASRTAYHLNLQGPAVSINSACSTSLLAVVEAVNSLRAGQCNMAIAGGSSVTSPIYSGHIYQEGSMLSANGHCRPFDNEATGTVFSDGAGVVLLKRLEDAQRDGDLIFGLIKGVGANNDGGGKGSFTAPSTDGQAEAIRSAIRDAGISAAEITYIEAHGTGTPIGDPIEFEGLLKAFGPQQHKQFCAIGSVKSNFGHLTQAAGVTGLIKTCLSLHYKKLLPSLGYQSPNKNIDFPSSPFYVQTEFSDWDSTTKRIAGVSSFGVGGTNVHVVMEEYQHQAPAPVSSPGRPYELLNWSAKSENSRNAYDLALLEYFQKHQDVHLADVSYTLQRSKEAFRFRRFMVSSDAASAMRSLELNPPTSQELNLLQSLPGEIVFAFPGQGAQYLNMASDLYKNEAVYREAIDQCALLLHEYLQRDIRQIIFPPEITEAANDLLRETRYTQPTLFVTEYALAKLWMYWGIVPTMLCGHSIGEYVAAHLAGVFTLEDGLKLIATRGAMVNGLPSGSMLSIRSSSESIAPLLTGDLSLAAVNSPFLCVVAGPDQQIQAFSELLQAKDILSKLLFTSHAFHSSMMDPIVADFRAVVAEVSLSKPRIPIVSTVTGKLLTDEQAQDPNYWANHLRNTVQFSKAIETILSFDSPLFLETGPGTTMTTLIKQVAGKNAGSLKALPSLPGKDQDYPGLLNTLGQLWNCGLNPNWENYYGDQKRLILNLPTYQFDRKRYWLEINKIIKTPSVNTAILSQERPIETINSLTMRHENLKLKIRQVLEDASGIEMENIGSDRNFLEIGLDSLLLTQVAISLKKEFNLPITFRKLNEEYSSIDLLAVYIGQNTAPEAFGSPVHTHIPAPIAVQPVMNTQYANPGTVNDTALGLIAQQLEILSKQVMLMHGQPIPAVSAPQTSAVQPAVNGLPKKASEEQDLSPQEKAEIQKPFGATPKIDRQSVELNQDQRKLLADLTERYTRKTIKSKNYAQESRSYMADPRVVSGFKPLTKELIYPIVINKSRGSRLWDLDGNEYIDTLNGFGSNLLGYQPDVIREAMHDQIEKGYEVGPQHELAAEVSKLVCEFTGFDRSALCSTGSEAVLGCIRIARTITGRSLIVAFTGSYHGIIDEVLVRGTKKLKSFPAAAGIMPEAVQNILVLDYGTEESLSIIKERSHEIAAVLVEPIQSRRPEFVPLDFLKELRAVTASSGAALIFDEVITGFRMHPGGAQALFDIRADLASYGKVVGAGIPIGVIAGKKQFMDALDGGAWNYGDQSYPEVGVTYFAGTFVRHPLALAAAKASLTYLKEKGPELQLSLNKKGEDLSAALNVEIEKRHLPFFIANYGSLWKVKFHEEVPYSELMFTLMREKGIHILDGFPCFITEAMSGEDLEKVRNCFIESMDEMIQGGFFSTYTQPSLNHQRTTPVLDINHPPLPGARLGKDAQGNPAWFIEDEKNKGTFLQVQPRIS